MSTSPNKNKTKKQKPHPQLVLNVATALAQPVVFKWANSTGFVQLEKG